MTQPLHPLPVCSSTPAAFDANSNNNSLTGTVPASEETAGSRPSALLCAVNVLEIKTRSSRNWQEFWQISFEFHRREKQIQTEPDSQREKNGNEGRNFLNIPLE